MATERSLVLADAAGEVERFVVVEETGRASRPKDAKGYSDSYVTVFQGALAAMSADRGLTRTDYRVWMAALARATIESPVWDAKPREMGADLGMNAKDVSRTITRLVEAGLLLRPTRGKLALPPHIAWRGTVMARETALKNRKEPA